MYSRARRSSSSAFMKACDLLSSNSVSTSCSPIGFSENDLRLFLSRMAFGTLEHRDVAKINRRFERFVSRFLGMRTQVGCVCDTKSNANGGRIDRLLLPSAIVRVFSTLQ